MMRQNLSKQTVIPTVQTRYRMSSRCSYDNGQQPQIESKTLHEFLHYFCFKLRNLTLRCHQSLKIKLLLYVIWLFDNNSVLHIIKHTVTVLTEIGMRINGHSSAGQIQNSKNPPNAPFLNFQWSTSQTLDLRSRQPIKTNTLYCTIPNS